VGRAGLQKWKGNKEIRKSKKSASFDFEVNVTTTSSKNRIAQMES
jgi:hypothetical protein